MRRDHDDLGVASGTAARGNGRRTRRRLIVAGVLAVLATVAATAVLHADVRWRVALLTLALAGKIENVSLPQLARMAWPGSGYDLRSLVDSRNPYGAIANPLPLTAAATAGASLYGANCASCHGPGLQGGAAPALAGRMLKYGDSDWALFRIVREGQTSNGMPAHGHLSDEQVWQLVAYIRAGNASPAAAQSARGPRAIREVTGERLREARREPGEWLMYSGAYDGRRHSPLAEITPANAGRLAVKWVRQFAGEQRVHAVTPLVNDGVMYVVESPNVLHALDAADGSPLWSYEHRNVEPVTHCCGRVNRGVAIHGSTVFMGTLDNHVVALDAANGALRWKVKLEEHGLGASISAAPLVVGDKLIVGYGGGDYGFRGYLDALSVKDGRRLWRFHTVPGPGEKGHDTWQGDAWKRGGGGTWLTGSYDPELNLVYWGVGNPGPNHQGEARPGDNLYTASVIALDPDTGTLKWHFQFTPHDERDWAANQIPVLVDRVIDGRLRKLMLWANRNGFFYVLDRSTGEFLRGYPFARQNWALGLDDKGRPQERPEARPDIAGRVTYPGPLGATNWWSPTYSERTGLFYVAALEWGQIVYKDARPPTYRPGNLYLGGGYRPIPGDEQLFTAVRAIDPLTGRIVWAQENPRRSTWWRTGGLVSTAGDVLFTGDGTRISVLDARTGERLWQTDVGGNVGASPIAYQAGGRQYFAIAAGRALVAVGLP